MAIELLTPAEAAQRLGICTKTLRQIRARGLIRYVAVTPRRIFYRADDCDAFIEARTRTDVPVHLRSNRSARRSGAAAPVGSFTARRAARLAQRQND